MRFALGIVGSNGKNPHWRCFEDFMRALADALRALGHEVEAAGPESTGRLLIFGGNNLSQDSDTKLPGDTILYNPEQLASAVGEHLMQNRALWKSRVVWDYSAANIDRLKSFGIEKAVLCPVGYVPSMTKIKKVHEDIDVLFYGSVNPKRLAILRALDDTGMNVVRLFGVYGSERDKAIARSKVVLNLHFYDEPVFEIFRVSHLLANKKCVVSEDGGKDAALEEFAARATVLSSRDRIVEECRRLVANPLHRGAVEMLGFEEFKKLDLVEHVRQAVAAS